MTVMGEQIIFILDVCCAGAKVTRSREKMANINPDAQAWTPNAQSASTPAVGRIQASNANSPYWSPGQQQAARTGEVKSNFSASAATGAKTFVPGRGVLNADVQEFQPVVSTASKASSNYGNSAYTANASGTGGMTNAALSANSAAYNSTNVATTSNPGASSAKPMYGRASDASATKYDVSTAEFPQGGTTSPNICPERRQVSCRSSRRRGAKATHDTLCIYACENEGKVLAYGCCILAAAEARR